MGDAADDLEWQDYRDNVKRPTDREIWSDIIYASAPLSQLQMDLIRAAKFLSVCPHPKKVVFRSQAKARKRARQLSMRFYHCVCGAWHLTTRIAGGCPICHAPNNDDFIDCGCYAELHYGKG